jgi:DnaJ like chaperone protein
MALQWTGKLVGGLIGMVTLGPPGALLGILVGHQFDVKSQDNESEPASFADAALVAERFFRTTFRVMGHVAKADGRVSEKEIEAARSVMSQLRLTPSQVRTAINHFTDGKQQTFDLDGDLDALRRACSGRPELVRVFLEIQVRAALAGNNLEGPARLVMQRVASRLGTSAMELAHIESILRIQVGSFSSRAGARGGAHSVQQLTEAYRVLEVVAEASNDEVVKAYRRQLSRHHPDKLKANGLPESMIEHAKQRTQQIIEAYELIKERRGI